MELKDKVVVITGGTKGFGKAMALLFLKEKAKVVICSHNKEETETVAKEIGALGIYADVTKEEDLTNLAEQTLQQYGRLDIWINNAGIWAPHDFVENFDMQKIKKIFDVNTIGTINGSRVALRFMKKINFGTIINIISTSALSGRPMSSIYSASKWAVNGFTKSIREENKDKSILILSIFPGGMKTSMYAENEPNDLDKYMDTKDVAKKVIENLKKEKPEEELIIKRDDFLVAKRLG